jgi:hypothetical protein
MAGIYLTKNSDDSFTGTFPDGNLSKGIYKEIEGKMWYCLKTGKPVSILKTTYEIVDKVPILKRERAHE